MQWCILYTASNLGLVSVENDYLCWALNLYQAQSYSANHMLESEHIYNIERGMFHFVSA